MGKLIDLTGQKFGRLTVIERAPNKGKQTMWKCRCDCKNKTICTIDGWSLRSAETRSCGCLVKENFNNIIHNKKHTRIYGIWCAIKGRCYNHKNPAYRLYGAEGKTVCEEWQEFKPFYDWAMDNGYKDSLTIERIDGTKGYSPENCRWATAKEQANNRRSNHYIYYRGKQYTMMELTEKYNVSYGKFKQRINKLHWTVEKALNTP